MNRYGRQESTQPGSTKRAVVLERFLRMRANTDCLRWTNFLFVAVVLGCSSRPTHNPAADEERAVREKFAELQSAVKSRDAEKLWALLDAKSRADAERAAKGIQTANARASAEEKTKLEQALSLRGTELIGLTGIGFLKTKRFQEKYHELPDSKIDKVVVQGGSATIYYHEADGDREKAILVRQDGEWKAWLTMPRVSNP